MLLYSQRFGNVQTAQVTEHWKWQLMQPLCEEISKKTLAMQEALMLQKEELPEPSGLQLHMISKEQAGSFIIEVFFIENLKAIDSRYLTEMDNSINKMNETRYAAISLLTLGPS